jgi:signal transduction histidine kinase
LTELENRRRQFYLTADIKTAKIVAILIIVPFFLTIFNDFQFLGLSTLFYELLFLRFAGLAFTVLLFTVPDLLKNPQSYDKSIFSWSFVWVIISLVIFASRPQNFLIHVIFAILLILILTLVLPQRFGFKIIIALTATIGELIILDLPSLTVPTSFSIVLGLVMANVIALSMTKFTESLRINTFNGHEAIIANLAKIQKTEQEVQVLNEKLKVVGSLTRHDVANKISAIQSYAYLLKKAIYDNPKATKYLEEIDSTISGANKLFEFGRLFEKIGSEQAKVVDVEKCFNEAAAPFANVKGINIINECQGLNIVADSFLSQLFYNLIDNSIKHGEKVNQIRLYYTKENGALKLFYEDNGVGISKANKPLIFNEGFTTGNGSGLGLKLIKKMVDIYAWTIAEEGEPGEGAKFTITIPTKTSA